MLYVCHICSKKLFIQFGVCLSANKTSTKLFYFCLLKRHCEFTLTFLHNSFVLVISSLSTNKTSTKLFHFHKESFEEALRIHIDISSCFPQNSFVLVIANKTSTTLFQIEKEGTVYSLFAQTFIKESGYWASTAAN